MRVLMVCKSIGYNNVDVGAVCLSPADAQRWVWNEESFFEMTRKDGIDFEDGSFVYRYEDGQVITAVWMPVYNTLT